MTDLREKLATTIMNDRAVNNWGDPFPSDYDLSDAIIAALPDMVKPLEWPADGVLISAPVPYQIWEDNGGSGAPDEPYEKYNSYRVFEPMMMFSIGPNNDGTDEFDTLEAAKAAAQAHYVATVMQSLGVQGGGT